MLYRFDWIGGSEFKAQPQRRRRGHRVAPWVTGAVLLLASVSSAAVEDHGITFSRSCTGPCLERALDCSYTVTHKGKFNDVVRIESAYDQIDPGDGTGIVRVPASGDLPIVGIVGNAFCADSGGTCTPASLQFCALPCSLGIIGSTISGLPGVGAHGAVIFGQNAFLVPTTATSVAIETFVRWNDECSSGQDPACPLGQNETLQWLETLALRMCIYVDENATGLGDGSSWCNAYVDLQDALAAAATAGTPSNPAAIRVAKGTYRPDTPEYGALGFRTATFQLLDNVELYGGYDGASSCAAGDTTDVRDLTLYETILTGDLQGDDDCIVLNPPASDCCNVHTGGGCDDSACQSLINIITCVSSWDQVCANRANEVCECVCFEGDAGDNAYHVVTGSGVNSSALLDGFTISSGNANGTTPTEITAGLADGGGLYVDAGSPTVANCNFRMNAATRNGGAVFLKSDMLAFQNTSFSLNTAVDGGAIYADGSVTDTEVRLIDCLVGGISGGNIATGSGGGVYAGSGLSVKKAFITAKNTDFQYNRAANGSGGGAYLNGDASEETHSFADCTFQWNRAKEGAGASVVATGLVVTFDNCLFEDNVAEGTGTNSGGGLRIKDSSVTITDSTFQGNTAESDGGAIEILNAGIGNEKVTLVNTSIVNNSAPSGGGVVIRGPAGAPTLVYFDQCTIDYNTAVSRGGGIYAAAVIRVTGGSFTGNSSGTDVTGNGGAICSFNRSELLIDGTTFTSNYAGYGGGAIYANKMCPLDIRNSNVLSNGVNPNDPTNFTDYGGGLFLAIDNVTTIISGCTIDGNKASEMGGGICSSWPRLIVEDTAITNNMCEKFGGGIATSCHDYPAIKRCKITGNSALSGGGLYIFTPSSATSTVTQISSTLIAENVATGNAGDVNNPNLISFEQPCTKDLTEDPTIFLAEGLGGGLYTEGAVLDMVNCTVANNSAALGTGGGVWWDNDGIIGQAFADVPLTISNSIFWGNTAAQTLGSQLRVEGPTTIDYSDFQGDFIDIDYNSSLGILDYRATSFGNVDPLFVSALTGNFSLKNVDPTISPCINAGYNSLTADYSDAEQHSRIKGCIVDMGALEYASIHLEAPVAEANGLEKNRFISFSVGNMAALDDLIIKDKIAVRVRLDELMNPQPSNLTAFPAPDFSMFHGQSRWVGSPRVTPDNAAVLTVFTSAKLTCTPDYPISWQWSPSEVLHVTGNTIVPSSTYSVQVFEDEGCPEVLEGMFSAPLTIKTARWGDVEAPFQDKSATGNANNPNVFDVVGVVDAVKVVSTALPRYRASVNTWGWPFTISVMDIMLVVDAVKGTAYSFVAASRAPAFCPCVDAVQILADFDGDGDIDEDDTAVAGTATLYFVANTDDDNGNGIIDAEEDGPIFGEDELTEIRFSTACPALDPTSAWWSVSWTEPDPLNPVFVIWPKADKSDGGVNPGTPFVNGVQYPWPPPSSVWMESLGTSDEIDLTFEIVDSTIGTPLGSVASGQQTKTTTISASSPCSALAPRYHFGVARTVPAAYGIQADITTRNVAPLCGGATSKVQTQSSVWAGVGKPESTWALRAAWVQHGYRTVRLPGGGGLVTRLALTQA